MSEKSSSSGSDEDVDPESGQPVELGGVLSKVNFDPFDGQECDAWHPLLKLASCRIIAWTNNLGVLFGFLCSAVFILLTSCYNTLPAIYYTEAVYKYHVDLVQFPVTKLCVLFFLLL